MIRLKYHYDAEVEFDEAVEFYDDKSFGLGERFQKAVFHTVESIRQNPETGMIWIQDTRLFIVNRFSEFHRPHIDCGSLSSQPKSGLLD